MIKCKHCEAEFEDWEISEFTVHLDEAHEVEFPICLGDHGVCLTPIGPVITTLSLDEARETIEW